MAIKAVIFDCFGVLTSDGWLPFCQKYFGDDEEKMNQARMLNKRVDGGLYGYNDMLRDVAELAQIPEVQARKEIEDNIVDEQIFHFIKDDLKPHYKIGMLSNAGDNWLNELFEPWQVALFDEIALSYELGVTKPHPMTYETIATRVGVLPEECLFIDDQERYVTGAKEAGMKSIIFVNTEVCINEIREILS